MTADPSTIAALCELPRAFRVGSQSSRELVSASGFAAAQGSIAPHDLRLFLEQHPDLIDEWVRWSEGKRTSEGWYLSPSGEGAYVGYVGRPDPPHYVAPLAEACAHFILHEVTQIHVQAYSRGTT